ncbi:Pisatin demethylase [Cyphellophora attinorum]|uniref:Pisatin demethylase n=1 Tax=Cyphellophora attinorum TaxID=1664694 RepID=A0A0N0NJL2_9EURO|nr:Pisatin demethylase [Phialophora attinorum]KPI37028.1 Pisatin demethylase [Phialophora attinorum]
MAALYGLPGDMHHTYIDLHQAYGDTVRIGPNCVSLAGLSARAAIYGISRPIFPKSDFYLPSQASIAGKTYTNLFNTTGEDFHTAIKRPVSRAYAMTTLLEYESFVDAVTKTLLRQLVIRYTNTRSYESKCHLDRWLKYYAYDVVGQITFGQSLGFLELGPDAEPVISQLRPPRLGIAVSQMPNLYQMVLKPLRKWTRQTPPTSPVVEFTVARMKDRAATGTKDSHDQRDMLSRFLKAQKDQPDLIDDVRVTSYATSNVNASADTTAITLCAAFYYLLKNPATMKELEEEIIGAAEAGKISSPCVSWTEAQKLPYLDAVIKEALRMHPAVGMMLERVTPPEGVTIYGRFYPGGTLLGISPWVIARDRVIYGDDADQWRPERWLTGDADRQSKMAGASLTFGGGTRTCIGKNISLLELYKVIPAIIQMFDVSLVKPKDEWRTVNEFLVSQEGLEVDIKRRS